MKIKLFITDLDGVMTDGGMYYTEKGDEFKRFHVADGVAFLRLKDAGIKTAICTNGVSTIAKNRAEKIKADYLIDNCSDKLESVQKLCQSLGIDLSEVVYIGDDIWDMNLLKSVGIKACPADAQDCIKEIPEIFILQKNGGYGCVREMAEIILKNK